MVANRFLMQFVADVLRIPVVASQVAELSALGAALAGAVGMGQYKGLNDLAGLDLGNVEYRPTMDAKTAALATRVGNKPSGACFCKGAFPLPF